MRRVAIVTDSVCCLPAELLREHDIAVVPLLLVMGGKVLRDGVDISPGEVYRVMRRRADMPTTSTPSASEFLDAYRCQSRIAGDVVCITLTSLQSKTFESAVIGKDLMGEECSRTTIEVIDSRAVAGAQGFIVLEAARAATRGADLAEVVRVARNLMSRVRVVIMLDTLYYLSRTGRVGTAAAWAGSVLSLKPLVGHSPETGMTQAIARPRTRAKAVEMMLNIMKDDIGDRRAHVMVHHADEVQAVEELRGAISDRFDCSELYVTEFTPLMGAHAGPGVLGVAYYADGT